MKTKIHFLWPLAVIPLIMLGFSILFRIASGPFWQYSDPCYVYYFNGIQILKGIAPTEVSHPGTPLQMLMALTIFFFNLGSSWVVMLQHALLNPELYISAVYTILVIGNFLTSIILGVYIYRQTKDLAACFLSQLISLHFLIMPSFDSGIIPVLPVVANVNAEPIFMIIMNLFNLLILKFYFADKKKNLLTYTILLALLCGFGLATKINFLIILFLGLLLVPWRHKILFVILSIFSFFLCTIPIIPRYPKLWGYMRDIIDHSARYGMGSAQFVDWKSFIFYTKLMLTTDGFFILAALGAFIVSSAIVFKNFQDRGGRFIWLISFCLALHIAATAKHFSFHYLLPAFGLFGSILPLLYWQFKTKNKFIKPLSILLIVVFSTVCLLCAIPYLKSLSAFTQEIRQLNDKIETKYPQCTIIPTTTVNVDFFLNQQMAYQRADGTDFRVAADDLYQLFPNSYYFFSEQVTSPDPQVESYGIWNYKQRVDGDDIIHTCRCAIFTKYGSDFTNYPYQFHLLEQTPHLTASVLTESTEKTANLCFSKMMDAINKQNYKDAFAWGMKAKELNFEPRGQLEYILAVMYQKITSLSGPRQ